ncbi:hypothetical protein CVT26_000685 [Gymnopilus dilepis]|uniref:protein-histidine N-methyltransferase n=1 Tax=Gymnopilus dilepis TaxID=231916 RepID=A0A409W759_9AGAR|nr:hypothetical protein CVT26_000685 [Gymnopilus dilepis]
MFKFDFNIEEADDVEEILNLGTEPVSPVDQPKLQNAPTKFEPFSEISLSHLLDELPSLISYSPLSIPLSGPSKLTTLIRRDLFDARFQLISEGAGDVEDDNTEESSESGSGSLRAGKQALAFLDAPSDLVPRVYEGGLKTWECSLDLVDYLDQLKQSSNLTKYVGKKALEVGCGTGVPSMYILRETLSLMSETESPSEKTEIHLQDYNASVLQLVTLPNLLLTWYASRHADDYRASVNDEEIAPMLNPAEPGELPITPELKSAFLRCLESLNIHLRFFSGSWDGFNPINVVGSNGYDVVLTSETIYRPDSLDTLIDLLQAASKGEDRTTLSHLVASQLQLEDAKAVKASGRERLCLVAAKILYFGVGGSVSDFVKKIEAKNALASTVWSSNMGVGRIVMSISWP